MDEICGEFAASYIPRWGRYWPCALPKGHDGEHRTGGTCVIHGPYIAEKPGVLQGCPKYPECATLLVEKQLKEGTL